MIPSAEAEAAVGKGVPREGRLRLGVLTPSSNTVLEPVTARLTGPLANVLSVHFARFTVTRIADEADSHAQFAPEAMLAAVRMLQDALVDAYLWSGTAAAWEGLETDGALVAAIERETGMPATTSTLALLDAFALLGVHRYGLIVPYVDGIADRIERNFAAVGFTCTASDRAGLSTNWDFATVTAADLMERARRVARSSPDAIVIHCTNLRGADVVEELEAELGIPVLDSVVVGLWGALRLLGIDVPSRGFGRLSGAAAPRV